MKPRRSLDNSLLALVTVAFSLLCVSALWIDVTTAPDAPVAASRA